MKRTSRVVQGTELYKERLTVDINAIVTLMFTGKKEWHNKYSYGDLKGKSGTSYKFRGVDSDGKVIKDYDSIYIHGVEHSKKGKIGDVAKTLNPGDLLEVKLVEFLTDDSGTISLPRDAEYEEIILNTK